MSTLYRPVLIESTDLPMDEFPEGTIATHPDHRPVERCSCSRWESEGSDRYDPDMVGWTALVPIATEEEWGGSRPGGDAWECQNRSHAESDADGWNRSAGPDGFQSTPVRRLVTPWEEA